MTKGVSEPYPDYIKRVCENDIARIVKIFDIRDNLADAPTEKQRENYKFAVEMLENKSWHANIGFINVLPSFFAQTPDFSWLKT